MTSKPNQNETKSRNTLLASVLYFFAFLISVYTGFFVRNTYEPCVGDDCLNPIESILFSNEDLNLDLLFGDDDDQDDSSTGSSDVNFGQSNIIVRVNPTTTPAPTTSVVPTVTFAEETEFPTPAPTNTEDEDNDDNNNNGTPTPTPTPPPTPNTIEIQFRCYKGQRTYHTNLFRFEHSPSPTSAQIEVSAGSENPLVPILEDTFSTGNADIWLFVADAESIPTSKISNAQYTAFNSILNSPTSDLIQLEVVNGTLQFVDSNIGPLSFGPASHWPKQLGLIVDCDTNMSTSQTGTFRLIINSDITP